MRTLAILGLLLGAAGCRGGATRVAYVGPPIGICAAGRIYPVPGLDAPTQPFVPLVAAAPVAEPEPVAEPPREDPPKEPPKKSKDKNKRKPKGTK